MKKSRCAILFHLAFFTVLSLSAQAPQWTLKVSGNTLNEVFMLNTTTGWAIGNVGEIWHTTDGGANWALQQSGTTSSLNSVWAADANNAWAVGSNGTIIKWNGSVWQTQSSGSTQFLSDIWGLNANAIWVVGGSGTMLKWDGVSWQTQNLGISNALYSVHGSSATNVWAVGSGGKVLRWDGSNWLSPTSGETNPLESVWAYDANNVWVTVNGNKIIKWGGGGFVTSKAQIFGTPALWDIHGTATNQIWAVGASGFILQWNGSAWQTIGSGISLTLNSVFGVNANNAWTVGEGGSILKWNGTVWDKQTPSNRLRLNAVHGYDANNVWAVGDGGVIFKWNGSDWLQQNSGTGQNLYGVWAHDANNIFAVGANGVALKWNGTVWAAHDAISFYDFNAVWGLDTSNVWAVGLAGFLRKWNGTGWQVENTATSWDQCAVGGVDATHVWSAGGSSFGSSMQRWNGSNWSQNATGSPYIFRALWAADVNNVWAVGDFGTVYKWNGSAWSNQSLGGGTFRGATGIDVNHVWLSGIAGRIMFWNGGCWQQQSTGTSVELRGIWAVDATHAWAVGNGGQILYFENNAAAAPVMSVEGNNTLIADGSTIPSTADSTAYGSYCPGGTPVSHTFTIKNDCAATGNLTLTGITSGNGLFTISGIGPFPVQVGPGQSTTFKVNFTRTGSGSSTINIANNDADNNPYTFVVSGDAVDQTPPVISCPTDKTVNANATCSGVVGSWNLLSKTDNCTASGSISQSQSPAGSTVLSGHNDAETVTLTANDGNGNTQSCQFTVTLKDVTKPVIQCPANQTVNADATCSGTVGAWNLISKSDNCTASGSISQSQTPAGSTVLSGHNDAETVTLTANDGNGNTQSCQFTVTLKDVTKPVIQCPANQTVNAAANCSGTVGAWNLLSKSDNCTASGSISQSQSPASSTVLSGHNDAETVTLTADDGNGNTQSCQFTVTLMDNQPPSLDCGNVTLQLDNAGMTTLALEDLSLIASDNCALADTFFIENTVAQPGSNYFATFSERYTPFASDFTQSRYQVLFRASELAAAGLSAGSSINAIEFDVSSKNTNTPIPSFQVAIGHLAATTISSFSTDPLTVVRPAAPYTTVSGWNTIAFNTPFVWDGVSGLLIQTCHSGGNNGSPNSDFVSVYNAPANQSVTNYGGACNTTSVLYTQIAVPRTRFIASSPVNEMPFDCNSIGSNTVDAYVEDAVGNITPCTSTVTVEDNQAPTITCPTDKTVNADANCSGAVGTWSLISKTDNCTASASISQSQSPASNTVLSGHNDVETVILTADDGNGNTESCEFTVTLKDVTAPAITCPGNLTVEPTVQVPCSATPAGLDAAIVENCDPILTYALSGATTGSGSGHVSGLVFNPGTTVVNYQVADAGANSSGCSFSVTVNVCVVDISGTIIWENDDVTGVGNVLVTLTGDEGGSMNTAANGNYSFSELSGDNFTITPSKTMNKLNGVTAADVTRIQQHVSGGNPFSDLYKIVAADVNKSNSVTSLDATVINQALLGNPSALAQFKTSWRFVPVSHTMNNPPWGFPEKIILSDVSGNVPNQNFFGIKTGDVITPFTDPANFTAEQSFVLNTFEQSLEAGSEITIEFSANQFSDLAALQFALKFNVEKLALAEIKPLAGLPFSVENFGTYHVSDGAINVVWSQAEGVFVDEAAPVFQLIFNVMETGGKLSEALQLSEETLPGRAYTSTLSESGVSLNFFNVTSADDPISTRRQVQLLQNRPNPFTGITTIGFVLPESCEAQLRVFDVSGRVLFSQKKNYPVGRHEERLELEAASGMLWYELTTPFGILTRKMVAAK